MDDAAVIEAQLGRPPRGAPRVAVRCPHGRPAVVEQGAYLAGGEPFPTTYYLTCPHAVARIDGLEAAGGVDRYERLLAEDAGLRASYDAAALRQRALRRPAAEMADGGASLALGIAGVARDGAVKCLHAHAAFALAEPGYEVGMRILAEAEPLFPEGRCCCA
ncbi:MAG TPA: DUF501 domain-containing protein [Gaiellales bacterium]|nr:DUF501 domain-containing protein [Gaiellales bacterium]